jgi:uncharacterized protein
MNLKERIKSDLLTAQKEADRLLVAILKLLWSEIGYLTVDKKDDDESVIAMLKKEARKRKDAIEVYKQAGDKQRQESEAYELKVIGGYLPDEMGEEEVRKIVMEVSKGSDLSGGRLIGEIMKKLSGKADGNLVAKIVGEL